jgi:hypothetical protein
MKFLLIIVFTLSIISCNTVKRSPSVFKEDELISRRKYIGEFIDYRHTDPETLGCMHLIWIKTTCTILSVNYAYKSCDLHLRKFIKKTLFHPGSKWKLAVSG